MNTAAAKDGARVGRVAVFNQLLETLDREHALRPTRTGEADGWDAMGSEVRVPEWVVAEHAAMRQAVNDVRGTRGLPPVSATAIARAEGLALGHSDYPVVFALACTELALQPQHPSVEAR